MQSTIEEYLNENAPGLIEILKTTNVVVCGSLVLYYKMKELGMEPNFIPNDIDIFYVKDDNNYEGYSKINVWFDEQFNSIDQNFNKTNFNVSFYSGNPTNYKDKEYVTKDIPLGFKNVIKHIRTCKLVNGIKIDLIHVDEYFIKIHKKNTIKDFIYYYFDFNFCKCWYDGIKIHAIYEKSIINMETKLYEIPMSRYIYVDPVFLVSYINDIKNENIPQTLNDETDPYKTFRRILKYKERGFTICVDDLCLHKSSFKKYIGYYLINNLRNIKTELTEKYGLNLSYSVNDCYNNIDKFLNITINNDKYKNNLIDSDYDIEDRIRKDNCYKYKDSSDYDNKK